MGSLNPDVKLPGTPNFISDQSQGAKAAQYNAQADSSTLSNVLGGLADIIPTLATGGDRLTKNAIDDSIYDSNDKLNREFGATDTIALHDAKVPTVPAALEASSKNLSRIGAAYEAGAISKNVFDIKVASMASDLRAQYASPYLRDYIDQKVAQVTGVDPQNQVRKDIFETIAKNKESGMWEMKQKMELAQQNAAKGIEQVGWENMSYAELINHTGAANRTLRTNEVEMSEMKRLQEENNLTDDTLIRTGQKGVMAFFQQNITNVNSQLGKSAQEVWRGLDQFDATKMTGEKKAQLAGKVANLQAKIMAEGRTYLLQNYKGYNLTDDKVNNMLTPLRMQTQNWVDAVNAGDIARLKAFHDQLDLQKTEDDLTFNTIEGARIAGAASRVMGPITSAAFQEKYIGKIVATGDRVFARNQLDKAISGEVPGYNVGTAFQELSDKKVKDVRPYQTIVGAPIDVIKDLKSSPEAVKNATDFLYSPDNSKFVVKLGSTDQAKMYYKLYSPENTQAYVTRRNAGDTEAFDKYATSGMGSFSNMFRQSAIDLQKYSINPGQTTVNYNADTHQFEWKLNLNNPQAAKGDMSVYEPVGLQNINRGLQALVPILEAKGINVDDYLSTQFKINGLTGKNGSWTKSENATDHMWGSFEDAKKADMKGSKGTDKAGGDSGNDTLQDTGRGFSSAVPDLSPENMTAVVDGLTGIPSFMEAVKSGDSKEIAKQAALAMATILPFPGGKLAGPVTKALGKAGGELVEPITLEAKRIAKELDALPSNAATDKLRQVQENMASRKETTSKLSSKLRDALEQLPKEEQDRILASMGKKSLDDL